MAQALVFAMGPVARIELLADHFTARCGRRGNQPLAASAEVVGQRYYLAFAANAKVRGQQFYLVLAASAGG